MAFKKTATRDSNCLLLVDLQRDFCDPNGALYVRGAENAVTRICAFLIQEALFPPRWETVYTMDWHLPELNYQTPWPAHCIQGREGAEIMPALLETYEQYRNAKRTPPPEIWTKGMNPEEDSYSAFSGNSKLCITPECVKRAERLLQHKRIFVAGVAQDICVYNTLRDLILIALGDHFSLIEKDGKYDRDALEQKILSQNCFNLEKSLGVSVFCLEDCMVGINPKLMEEQKAWLEQFGVKFITTEGITGDL